MRKAYKGYLIQPDGRIYSLKSFKYLKPQTCKIGYNYVFIMIEGKRKRKAIHRLVAEAYIDNHKNKLCVNHIDGDKTNNSAWNLEWCTYSENQKHSWDSETRPRKYKSKNESRDRQIRNFGKLGYTTTMLSIRFNLCHSRIGQIIRG